MTTAVHFDLDGTLLTYAEPFDDLVAATLPDPTPAMVETYTERVLSALRASESDPYERAFAAVVDAFDLAADPAALASDYVEREVAATRLDPPARRLVETVADAHPTGVLTNGHGPTQRAKIREHGLDRLVDEVVVSGEVGVRKPDPGIFDRARERLPADRHVYVGDTFAEDVVPARDLGFETVYVGDEDVDAPVAADREALSGLVLALLDGP